MKTKKINYSKIQAFDNCLQALNNLEWVKENNLDFHIVQISTPQDKDILFKKIKEKNKKSTTLLLYKTNILAKHQTEIEIWKVLKEIVKE